MLHKEKRLSGGHLFTQLEKTRVMIRKILHKLDIRTQSGVHNTAGSLK